MRRRRRNSEIQLNFDGLTDSVTNLVGALILLVVLLIGLTKEITSDAPPAPPSADPSAVDERLARGSQTVEELLRKLEQLQARIVATDQQIRMAEERTQRLRERARVLAGEPARPSI